MLQLQQLLVNLRAGMNRNPGGRSRWPLVRCSYQVARSSIPEYSLEGVVLATIQVNTPDRSAMVDVTDAIARKVQESGICSGLCVVCVSHTTAGITINEGADPSVAEDILRILNQMVPFKGPYRHGEGNSPAHIKASLIGSSVSVMIENSRLILGRWQSLFFCEFDGPRTRKVFIKIISH